MTTINSVAVLVFVQATITGHHKLGGLDYNKLIVQVCLDYKSKSTVVEAGKSKTKVLADVVSGESVRPHSWMVIFLLTPRMVNEGMGTIGGGVFIRALTPFMGAPSLWPNPFPNFHHIGD